ncbi:hypothetical protein O0L34_g9102 [Tuta absoluta]|nr:hypothetical protein O0L34_g9102 [Tuta absoluta]
MKTSSSPGGGLYLPTGNGIEAALALAKTSKDIVVGFNEAVVTPSEPEAEPSSNSSSESDVPPTPQNLPSLDPGDKLLIASTNLEDDTDSPDVQKRNVLNKITDRGKDIISIIYPPYEEERNEQKFDDSERKKAEKYALSTDQILLTDALGMKPDVKLKRMLSQPTPLAQVVEGRVITESTKEALEGIEGNSKLWIGKDYCNFIVKDFNNLDLPFVGKLYTYNIQVDTLVVQEVEGRVITESTKEALEGIEGNSKLWIGKDYCNFIVKDFNNLDLPFVDLVDRNTTPRMPWHDVGCVIQGAAARDVARHFIQRWNAIKLEKARQNVNYPYLMPKTYSDIKPLQDLEKYLDMELNAASCQVLRSVSSWSCGFLDPDTVEQSIHEAYVDTITRAQHYVYIENQFFITQSRSSSNVRNQIGEALYNRIVRAFRANEKFRVFVVMPLLPGFEGEVGAPSGTSLHAVTHWNYQSICRSREAILTRLYEAGIEDPSEYITFHGLRTHSVLEGEPITELVYVHSKLLIADDKVVICGSANINDRSMIGTRDSEIAVLFQDEKFDEGMMNGQTFPTGRVAGSLRKRLFREHLGLMNEDLHRLGVSIDDPCCDQFYKGLWKSISRNNTEMYEDVFHPIPTNAVHSFAEFKKYQEEHPETLWHKDPALANRKIDLIRGYLVDMPLDFLCNEVLTPRNTSMEGMMPTALWT